MYTPACPPVLWLDPSQASEVYLPYICPSSKTAILNQDSWLLNKNLDPTGKWCDPFGKVSTWQCRKMLLALRKTIRFWRKKWKNHAFCFCFAYLVLFIFSLRKICKHEVFTRQENQHLQSLPFGSLPNRSSHLGKHKQTNACWSIPRFQTVFYHFKICRKWELWSLCCGPLLPASINPAN